MESCDVYNTLEKRRNFFTKRNCVTTVSVRVKGKTTAGVAHVQSASLWDKISVKGQSESMVFTPYTQVMKIDSYQRSFR